MLNGSEFGRFRLGGRPFFPNLFDHIGADETIKPWSGWDQRGVDVFVADLWLVRFPVPGGDGALEEAAVVRFEFVAPRFGLAATFDRVFGGEARLFEFGFVVGAAAFVTEQGPLEERLGQRHHVLDRFGEDHVLVGPVAAIGEADPKVEARIIRQLKYSREMTNA